MKRACLLLIFAAALYAQQRQMTVAQLTGFIQSSVEQKLSDKEVAETLKKTQLTEKLDQNTLGQLMSLGAGPRTSAALKELSDNSASLPAPKSAAAAAPKPVSRGFAKPSPEEQKQILEQIREYATNYTENLPNFICTQVTRRQIDSSGSGQQYRQADKLQEQLTYFDHKESYKVLAVNGEMVQHKEHEKLGGATSSGEFGSMLSEIFAPETQADFQYAQLGKLDGRIVNEYDYRVSQPLSHYSIYHAGVNRTIIAGYHGRIWAARDTNTVMRITLECEDIPKDFPVQEVSLDLWYDVTKIEDQEYVLPLKWDLHSREGKYLSWNSAEFALYRKFGTSSSITFDAGDDAKDQKKDEAPKPPVKKQQ
jgi:hypothetical protein